MELFRHLKIRNWTGNIINNVKQKNFKYLKSNPKTNINRTTNKLCKAKRKKIKRAIYSVICSCLKTRKQKGHSTKIDQTMSCWEWHTTKRNLNSFKGNWINKKRSLDGMSKSSKNTTTFLSTFKTFSTEMNSRKYTDRLKNGEEWPTQKMEVNNKIR